MAETPNFVGSYRKGDQISIPLDFSDGVWEPGYYDVVDNESMLIRKYDQAVTSAGQSPFGVVWIKFTITDDGDITWEDGQTYSLLVKENVGQFDTDNTNQMILTFKIDGQVKESFLGVVEKDRTFYFVVKDHHRSALYFDVIDPVTGTAILTNESMTGPGGLPGNSLFRGSIDTTAADFEIGRTYAIRVKNDNSDTPETEAIYSFSILPKLEFMITRVISQGGENMVIDNFVYDQAGNITGLRIRLFEDAASASNATQGVTDPEPGEIASYLVDQEHDVARNVRTFHRCVQDYISASFATG